MKPVARAMIVGNLGLAFLSPMALGAAPHAPIGGAKPVEGCTFDSITDQCKLFDPKKEKIELKDGTFIPNFPKILGGKPHSDFEAFRDAIEKDKALQAKKFAFERKLDRVLRKIPDAAMHPDYKIYLRDPQRLIELSTALEEPAEMKEDAEEPTLSLWWPPEKPVPADNPEEKSVGLKEARRKLAASFPNKDLRREFLDVVADAVALSNRAAEIAAAGRRRRPRGRYAGRPGAADSAGVMDNPTINAMSQVTEARSKKVQELMTFARKAVIDLVRRGRKDEALSAEEKNMITKIRNVHLNTDPNDPGAVAKCTGVMPNAFYNPEDHSITLCRQYYNLPDADIVATLGHELFHPIDPCNAQFDSYSVDAVALQKLREKPSDYPLKEIRDDNERFAVYQALLNGGVTGKTAAPFDLGAGPEAVDYFAKKGVLKRLSAGGKFHPEPAKSSYPFRNVYACLKKPEHGGFRSESPEAIARFAKEVATARARARSREPGYDPERDAEEITKSFAAHPECLQTDYRSQMCETMADWAGTKVLAKFLQGKRLVTPEEKMGALSLFALDACLKRAQAKRPGVVKRPSTIVAAANETRAEIQDEHPDPIKRVNDIVLREESIALALCGKAPEKKSCEEESK